MEQSRKMESEGDCKRRSMAGTTGLLHLMMMLLLAPQLVRAFQITVNEVECVQQFVNHEGAPVSGNFVVVDKKFDWQSDLEDIEMVVTGPTGNKVLSAKARGGQKYSFRAPAVGHYKICFSNPTGFPEKVEFTIHVGMVYDQRSVAKDEHFDPLQIKIAQLRDTLEKVVVEQEYYKARDLRHKRTNESTRNRVLWYTAIEYITLIGLSFVQLYLIRRLFSKRIGYNKV